MVDKEYLDDGKLIRRFSTLGFKLRQVETGELYDDPVDSVSCSYTYEETNIPISEQEPSEGDEYIKEAE